MKRFSSLAFAILLSLSLTACNLFGTPVERDAAPAPAAETNDTEAMPTDDEAMDSGDTAMDSEEESEKMVKGFRYEEYSEARFNELKGKQPIVLNFHADWCPKCRALDEVIETHRDEFPEDVVMFDVDYDTYEGLKKAYDIKTQTTLVFFDRAGEQVAKEYNPAIDELKELMASL